METHPVDIPPALLLLQKIFHHYYILIIIVQSKWMMAYLPVSFSQPAGGGNMFV